MSSSAITSDIPHDTYYTIQPRAPTIRCTVVIKASLDNKTTKT